MEMVCILTMLPYRPARLDFQRQLLGRHYGCPGRSARAGRRIHRRVHRISGRQDEQGRLRRGDRRSGRCRLGRPAVKVTVDTNVLVRSVVHDDPEQARVADDVLRTAALIAVPLPCLCEFVRVLRRVYDIDDASIGRAIRALLEAGNVVANRPAVEAGLALPAAGGDFADGVMAYEGAWLGGDTFVSLDRKTVSLLSSQGRDARLPD